MTEAQHVTQDSAARTVSLSHSAAERVGQLIEMEGKPGLMLRLSIVGGGCSGFSYKFDLDDQINDDDKVFETDGIKMVVDETSLDFVGGAMVDFVEDMMGASFKISNPNASSSCGCGSSFSV